MQSRNWRSARVAVVRAIWASLLLSTPFSFAGSVTSSDNTTAPAEANRVNNPRLPKVHIEDGYFVRDGKRFFPGGSALGSGQGCNAMAGAMGPQRY